MKSHINLISVLCACIFTNSLMACFVPPWEPPCLTPTLYEVVKGSPMVVNAEPLKGVTESGYSWVKLSSPDQTQIVATILLEEAAYANQNEVGIYNYNGPGVAPSKSEKLLILKGSDGVGDTAKVQFDLLNKIVWYDRNGNHIKDPGETAHIGNIFGFYLISPDTGYGICNPTFYTDELLNPDSTTTEHGLVYDTSYITGAIKGNPDVVVSFEDLLKYHADFDYNDMVFGVTRVTPVPEPATILILGLGGLVLLRKRRS
jgi:hypothetical protein